MDYTTITSCRSCGSPSLVTLLGIGKHCVNDFVTDPLSSKTIRCPITLCACNNCTLVQLLHTVSPEHLYTGHYWYSSGATQTMRDALRDVARIAYSIFGLLEPSDIVLDIGSNDGTYLRQCKDYFDATTVGVEPAKNFSNCGLGIDIFINSLWSAEEFLTRTSGRKASLVTALGMLYDLDNPNKFIEDVKLALAPNGLFIAQLMTLNNMINMADVGNLAHEHLEFYTIKSLSYLLEQHGLEIIGASTSNINGESDRFYIRHKDSNMKPNVFKYLRHNKVLMEDHENKGLSNPMEWSRDLCAKWEDQKEDCLILLHKLKREGKKVWIYGASTKGNTILQYYGIDCNLVEAARDISPSKWGKFTVGSNIPIFSPEEAKKANPDYYLVLPYSFIDEFMHDEQEWLLNGGKFIVPIPELKIYDFFSLKHF